jgi:hypothetical protein
MASALVEELRATRYRQRLAALVRRPSCRSIAVAIGTAPIHRNFFAETAAAIEGLPTGGTRKWNGITHRQVQYAVHLRIDETLDCAIYYPERDLLLVPSESAFDTLDGQARLLGACVHVGLNIEGRNLDQLDSECAARIAGQLYRLYENVSEGDSELVLAAAAQRLEPELQPDKTFYIAARETLFYLRAMSMAGLQMHRKLKPGSFMRIFSNAQRDRLHEALKPAKARLRQPAPKPIFSSLKPPSRFLALQVMEPSSLMTA